MRQEFIGYERPSVITHIGYYVDTAVHFLLSTQSPERAHPLLLSYEEPFDPSSEAKYVLYNTEQCTLTDRLSQLLERARQPDIVAVWDYSPINVSILRDNGIVASHVPLKTGGCYLERLRDFYDTIPKEYDVGFCGSMSDRRHAILQALAADKGLRVLHIGGMSGDERDRQLARCKVIINIHYADNYQIFEAFRCEPWLALGSHIKIVSENSLDNDDRCINVPYDQLVEKTASLFLT
jgi:hypothetical protein